MKKHVKILVTAMITLFMIIGGIGLSQFVYAQNEEVAGETLENSESENSESPTVTEAPEDGTEEDFSSLGVDEETSSSSDDSSQERQRDVHEMTSDELFCYVIGLSSDELDELYDSCDDLDVLMSGFSDEQVKMLQDKFGNGEEGIMLASSGTGSYSYHSTRSTMYWYATLTVTGNATWSLSGTVVAQTGSYSSKNVSGTYTIKIGSQSFSNSFSFSNTEFKSGNTFVIATGTCSSFTQATVSANFSVTVSYTFNGAMNGTSTGSFSHNTGYVAPTYTLDLNCTFDNTVYYGLEHATANVYINNTLVSSNTGDFCKNYVQGTTYKFVITVETGYSINQTTFSGTVGTSNIDIRPLITSNKYTNTLKYNANGGTGAPSNQTASVTYPSTQSTFAVSTTKPTKTGYTFAGWYTAASGGTKVGSTYSVGKASNAGNQSVTLYAQWTANSYTLTIDPNGGSYNGSTSTSTKAGTYGSSLEVSEIPTKTGYTFLGWSKSGSGTLHSGQPLSKSSAITVTEKTDSDGTAYTNYSMNYTNSGTGTTWPNMEFFYYPYESGHTYRVSFDVRVNSTSGLGYSHIRHSGFRNNWEANSNNLNYTTSGWEHRSMDRTFTGTTISMSGNSYTINPLVEFYCAISAGSTGAFNFDLKNLNVYDVTSEKYVTSSSTVKNGATVEIGAGNTTLTAQWKANTYTVTYDGNGGEGSMDSETVTYGSDFCPKDGTFTKKGYRFHSWWADTDGDGKFESVWYPYQKISWTYDRDITLQAAWAVIQYDTWLNPNGGHWENGTISTDSKFFNYLTFGQSDGNLITESPVREGYIFDGWYTSATGGVKVYEAVKAKDPLGSTVYLATAIDGTDYWKDGIFQYESKEAMLTLYAHYIKLSDFKLANTVTGNMGSREKEFDYTLTLPSSLSGKSLSVSYADGSDGLITVDDDGKANVSLKSGESITIDDLTSEEAEAIAVVQSDYGSDGYTTTSDTSKTDDLVQIEFVNDKTSSVPTGVHNGNASLWILLVSTFGIMMIFLTKKIRKH